MVARKNHKKVLIVCAHPDDEILGAGGAIQHHISNGDSVSIVYVTDGFYQDYDNDLVQMKRSHAKQAASMLGVEDIRFLGKHGLRLDTYPKFELNGLLTRIFGEFEPEIVYTHHWGDVNDDHQVVFDMAMVASRPHRGTNVKQLLAFETLSSTEWSGKLSNTAFIPNHFLILNEKQVEAKFNAFACYKTEVFEHPHPRSKEGIESLARYRGQMMSRPFAEAFFIVRSIV